MVAGTDAPARVTGRMSESVGILSVRTWLEVRGLGEAAHMDITSFGGVSEPDTKLAKEVTAFIRDTTSELVYHHSRRVFWFGALQGRNRGLSYDPELLYVGAMFHDVGLSAEYHASGRRFEVDGADAAKTFL